MQRVAAEHALRPPHRQEPGEQGGREITKILPKFLDLSNNNTQKR
jgi:hypothetical protein